MGKCLCWVFVALCVIQPTMSLPAQAADRPAIIQTTAATVSAPDSVEIREFEVRVDNKPVGTHRLTVKSDGAKQTAAIQTDIRIDLIVYAYVFKFRGTEIWRDGRVDNTDHRTEDGSKKRSFSLKTDGAVQQIFYNGKSVGGSTPNTMTTAYWRLPTADFRTTRFPIVDVDTGKTHQASLSIVGPDTVSCAGRSLNCQHFKIDGSSPSELWFDDRDLLVRQRSVEQGHLTELRLKQIRIAKDEH